MPEEQAKFEGWAIVEVMGHQKYAGFVTTEAYGGAVLFRVDVPGLLEQERTLVYGEYVCGRHCSPGAVIREEAVQPYTKLFGAASIYCITPCTEETAVAAVEEMAIRPHHLLSLPAPASLAAPAKTSGIDAAIVGEDEGDF